MTNEPKDVTPITDENDLEEGPPIGVEDLYPEEADEQ